MSLLHLKLSALMADVASLRRTLLQGPGDLACYKNELLSAMETAKSAVEEAMQSYDDMIRRIEGSRAWRN